MVDEEGFAAVSWQLDLASLPTFVCMQASPRGEQVFVGTDCLSPRLGHSEYAFGV